MMWRSSLFIKGLFGILGLAALLLGGWLLFAASPQEGLMDERQTAAPFAESAYQVYWADFEVPEISLTSQHRKQISWSEVAASEKPVFVQFIFTSCPTICPVLSAEFAQLQQVAEREVELISVSIDPEYDTPERLMAYGEKFGAMAGWRFLTGAKEDIVLLQEVFDNYEGNKMYHKPVTFLKVPDTAEWMIFDGFISGKDLFKKMNETLRNLAFE